MTPKTGSLESQTNSQRKKEVIPAAKMSYCQVHSVTFYEDDMLHFLPRSLDILSIPGRLIFISAETDKLF
jgi:hypothetical protein